MSKYSRKENNKKRLDFSLQILKYVLGFLEKA